MLSFVHVNCCCWKRGSLRVRHFLLAFLTSSLDTHGVAPVSSESET